MDGTLDMNNLADLLQHSIGFSGYTLQFYVYDEAHTVNLDEAKADFKQICMKYLPAIGTLREALMNGAIDGGQYEASRHGLEDLSCPVCLFGTLRKGLINLGLFAVNAQRMADDHQLAVKGAEAMVLPLFERMTPAEELFLAIGPYSTPDKHPVAALVLMWLDELFEELRVKALATE